VSKSCKGHYARGTRSSHHSGPWREGYREYNVLGPRKTRH